MRKQIVILSAVVIVVVVAIACVFVFRKSPAPVIPEAPVQTKAEDHTSQHEIIGTSVENRKIESFTYGAGSTTLIFAGGMHGGYEWNSVLLAYNFMDYLDQNPDSIPKNLKVIVIPSINPDGVYKVIGKEGRFALSDVPSGKQANGLGRMNAHDVDLNRNFACHWKATSTWQSKPVSAGTKAFSEPEAQAVRDFVVKTKPVGVIFWHSQSNAVYASECDKGILPVTLDIMNAYAKASGYAAVKKFDAYPITGDSEGWLASIGIPAITVELKTHETVEWKENLAGIKALFEYYSKR